MDSIGPSRLSHILNNDEIERLYDELQDQECECYRDSSCDFHRKLIQIKDLQSREIEAIEHGFSQLQSSLLKALPLLEKIDEDFDKVLK